MSKLRCYTCLEPDRKLRPLQDQLKYLLTLLCPEIYLKINHTSMYLICWECECMVNKMKLFQTRLRKVNQILTLYVKGRTPIQEGLSSLKQSKMETITHTLPRSPILPENLPKLPNVLKLPHNVHKLPSSDILAKRILIDTEIKIERENEDTFINDFDELIKPATIQQVPTPCEPLLLPSRKRPKITKKSAVTEVPPPKPETEKIVTPATNYVPQKVFINTPKQQVALRGLREAVKVTVDEPNFTVTAKESPVFFEKIDRRKREFRNKVLPATIKGEEIVLRPYDSIAKNAEEASQSRGINDYQLDEAKLIIMNETELDELRRIKRKTKLYLGSLYKCRKCIEWFHSQKKLDEHLLKHDESRGNSICEICEQRFADDLLREHHYKQHFIIYECLQCPYRITERHKIYVHGLKVHHESTFHCSKCDAVFNTFRERRSHVAHYHRQKKACQQCGKMFVSSCMKLHMLNVHKGKKIKCLECGKMLKASYLKNHINRHKRGTLKE